MMSYQAISRSRAVVARQAHNLKVDVFKSILRNHSRDTELIEDIGSVFSLFIIKNSPIFIFGLFLCLLGCRHFLIFLKIFILGSVLICLEFKSHTRNLKSHTRNPELSIKKYTIFYDIELTSNFDSMFAFKASFEVHQIKPI